MKTRKVKYKILKAIKGKERVITPGSCIRKPKTKKGVFHKWEKGKKYINGDLEPHALIETKKGKMILVHYKNFHFINETKCKKELKVIGYTNIDYIKKGFKN